MPPNPPSNSRLPQLAVWSDYGTVYINLSYWRRDRHFTWSSEPRKSLTICRAKAIPSILSYFKTLNFTPVPGIQPATSRSAVKRSTETELILPR